ncbi:MAG: CBS domain-containing protein [Nitrospiraceae bacterium]|nr:MAG: CBS domain-containing protein [Nitrospiraceae bacterium]
MFLDKKVKDLMIPIKDYVVTTPDRTLQEAVLEMRRVYCEVETGKCTEAGHRTGLVMEDDKLVGIIDFQSIMRALMPEIAGKLSDRLAALGQSIAFAEADAHDLDEAKAGFKERVLKNAKTSVGTVMLKLRGQIDANAEIMEGLKLMHRNRVTVLPVFENDKVVGVLRDSDLFLATANILAE